MRPVFHEIRKIAKKHNVKIFFKRLTGNISGTADVEKGIVTINNLLSSRQETLSAWFHELSHCLAYRKGLWKNYHETEDDELRMKTALKCEKYIDRTARFLCYQHDARVVYLASYEGNPKEMRAFLKNYYEGEEK